MSASLPADSAPGFRRSGSPSMKTVSMPRRRPKSISESESPIMTLVAAVISGNSATACSKRPGSGLRHLH
jgi:hypothetical protein